ncbi:MAG: nicotinate (nicotinamide) nucleotide adenylyltransferase [Thermodesulfobacteriota bacterium]
MSILRTFLTQNFCCAVVSQQPARRLGILGGTFDPVHLGHFAVAQAALDSLVLDQVLFIPSFKPPHKTERAITPFAQRLAMLKLALAGHPAFQVSDLEGERQDFSYTIDTLQELRKRLGGETTLYFLMGFDAFVEMATWKQYRDIPRFADIVVINRPHSQHGTMALAVQDVFGIQGGIFQKEEGQWQLTTGGLIHELVMDEVPVSSSAIRQALSAGEDVTAMLHPMVSSYIKENSLYVTG